MPTISRPVGIFIALAVTLGIIAYAQTSSDPPKKAAALATNKGKTVVKSSEFNDEDYTSRFESPTKKSALRNVFMPLLRNDARATPDTGMLSKDILRVPGNLAGGDPNWIFTGYAVLNGEKSGLLENRATHQSALVKEGQDWKMTRVIRINSGSIVFADIDNSQVAVMRFDPTIAAKSDGKNGPDLGLKPLDPGPAIQGQIGPGGPAGPGGPGGPGGPNGGGPRIFRGGLPGGAMVIEGGAFAIGG